jgi:hypothetical protein
MLQDPRAAEPGTFCAFSGSLAMPCYFLWLIELRALNPENQKHPQYQTLILPQRNQRTMVSAKKTKRGAGAAIQWHTSLSQRFRQPL